MRVILISLDAAFDKDMPKLKKMPHIGRLIQHGAAIDTVGTVYPAMTYPAHVSMITGLDPLFHGIAHNQPFDIKTPAGTLQDESRPWHWDIKDIQVPTLFDSLAEKNKTSAAILWPVTGKSRSIRYLFSEVLALPGENQALKMLQYGNPFYILSTELMYGRKRKSVKEPYLSDYATLQTIKLLQKRRPPDLIATHLVDLDAMRHHYGVFSPQADEALQRLDARIGEILAVMDRKNLWQDTCILLVSDHGQKNVNRYIALEPFLQKHQLPAHAQSFGTGAGIHVTKPGQEKAVFRLLEANHKELGIKTLYDRASLDAMGAGRPYAIGIEGEEGVAYLDCSEGIKNEKATHGFPPDDPSAQCLMILCGTKDAKERLKKVKRVTDVKALVEKLIFSGGESISNPS